MNMLNDNETNPFTLWAEIHRLRAEFEGPHGYDSWKSAAVAERLKRVELQKRLDDLEKSGDGRKLFRVHVNQHAIKKNRKEGTNDPVITVKSYNSNDYAHEVYIDGPCKIVYKPNDPLSCGAHVWIETRAPMELK